MPNENPKVEYNKVLDFRQGIIVNQDDKLERMMENKEKFLDVLENEGLWGFFGIERPTEREEEKVTTPEM